MSQNAKITTAIIAVIVVAGGIWAYVAMNNNSQMAPNPAYQAPASQTATQDQTPPQTTNATNTPATPAVTDDSNASIDQDMSGIDGQMTGLNTDSSNVDQQHEPATGAIILPVL